MKIFALIILVLSIPLQAAEWSSTNIQLLSGTNFELGPEKKEVVTIEHISGYKYGENFFFFDTTQPTEDQTSLYGEYVTYLSLGKMTKKNLSAGPMKDLRVVGSMEWGNNLRRYLAGLGLQMKVPGFQVFNLDFMWRDDPTLAGNTFQITLVWKSNIKLKSQSFWFEGFLDYAGEEGNKKANLHTSPRFLWEIAKDSVQIGVEFDYWKNKFGVDGVNESAPQAMIKWIF